MPPPLDDALLSLEGLSVGDAFGERFFTRAAREWVRERHLPAGPWRWTDDTHMACSIVEVLAEHGRVNQDALAGAFAKRFAEEPHRGYGAGAARLLARLAEGAAWREEAPRLFGGGSFGNGGAMRAAPVGGFHAGEPARAAEQARLSAAITHAHPEGQAGAMAVAAAAALAAAPSPPTGGAFLEEVLHHVSLGETRNGIHAAVDIPRARFSEAAGALGTGLHVSAMDTVPFCLWVAAHHLHDFEEAVWYAVAGYGDRDTTCAIVGGIVALSSRRIPTEWLRRREPLPGSVRALTAPSAGTRR